MLQPPKFLISLRSLHVPGDNKCCYALAEVSLDRSLMQSYPLIYQFPTTMYVGEYFCTMYILMLMARLSARSLMFRSHLTTILHGNDILLSVTRVSNGNYLTSNMRLNFYITSKQGTTDLPITPINRQIYRYRPMIGSANQRNSNIRSDRPIIRAHIG